MKLKHVIVLIPLCIYLPFLIYCSDQASYDEKKETSEVFLDKGDSIYKGTVNFIAYDLNFPIEKISKYWKDDTSRVITNKAAHHRHGYKQSFTELIADNAVKYSFPLPNKANISLNSGSSLVFHPSIANYFELNGEGYFHEIAEDSTKILVNNKVTVIADKGTSINITAYTDSGKKNLITVALVKGHALLTSGKLHTTLNKSGRKAVVDLTNKTLTNGKCEVEDMLAWTRNEFRYNDIDHYDLLQKICRWYDLELEYPANLSTDHWVFGGDYKLPVQDILERLNTVAEDRQHRIEGKKLIVSRK